MKPKQRVLITIGIGVVLVLGFYLITNTITKYTGFFVSEDVKDKESDFVLCLKEQGITLYINTEDVAQTLKNIQLIDYIHYFKIKNCLENNQECSEKEVNSFPTWVVSENKINKDISFEELSGYSGCKLR